MLDYDQLFKQALERLFAEFMHLFFPALAEHLDLTEYTLLDKETFTDLPEGEKRLPDLAILVRRRTGEQELVLVHIEAQTTREGDMPFRMFEYYLLLRLKYGYPVVPIVVYLRRGLDAVVEEYREVVLEEEYFRLRYHVVSLPHLSAEEYLVSGDPLAAALSTWMRSENRDWVERKMLGARGVVYSDLSGAKKEMALYLLDAGLLLEAERAALFRERFRSEFRKEGETMRYVTTWEQLALEEGREEGITFGRLEGEREMLLRQLTRKFGVLPPAILERVQSETDLAQLEMWSLNLLEAKSLPEVGL